MQKQHLIKFLFKLSLLIIPLGIVLIYIETKLDKIENTYNVKRSNFEHSITKIEVVVLGDSHSLYAINPDYINYNTFNLSNHSQSIYYSTEILLKYLDRLTNLKCVILSIGYISMYSEIYDGREAWRENFYYHFWNIEPLNKKFDFKKHSLISLYSPTKSFEYFRNDFYEKLDSKYKANGWCDIGDSIDNSLLDEKYARYYIDIHHKEYYIKSRFDEHYNKIKDLITELNKRNIKLIFITLPVTENYSKLINTEIYKSDTLAIHQFCRDYSNCSYLNYFDDRRFIHGDFSDVHHLNRKGAAKMSKILNEEISGILK